MRDRIPALAVGAAVIGLVAWSVWQRWEVLGDSPFPLGVDGFFYPIQVRSLLEHGTLAYPASPLTFWWMAPFAAVTDPIVGAKLGAAIGGALVAVPAYLVGARLGRGRGPGLVAAALATTSASSLYLSIEFVKQGIGLTVALFALWLVLRAIETPSRGRVIGAVAGVVAALLAHKVAAAIVVMIAVPAAIAEARGRGALRGRRLIYLAGGAIVLGALAAVLGVVFPQRFVAPADLALVRHAVTSDARWDVPALAAPHLTLWFGHEVAIAAALALCAAVVLVGSRLGWIRTEQSPGERAATWIPIVLALALAIPWLAVTDPQGLAFRLRLAAFVPMALCGAVVARVPLATLSELLRDLACVGIAVVACWRGATLDHTEGRVLAHPALVAGAMALDGQIPANTTVIVPERHVAFMVAWYTRAPVSLRPEPIPYAQRVRVLLPLSPVTGGPALEDAVDTARREPIVASPIGVHPRHRNALVLVAEPTWDFMLTRMSPKTRRRFTAWPTI